MNSSLALLTSSATSGDLSNYLVSVFLLPKTYEAVVLSGGKVSEKGWSSVDQCLAMTSYTAHNYFCVIVPLPDPS